jgi:hypothetical protein
MPRRANRRVSCFCRLGTSLCHNQSMLEAEQLFLFGLELLLREDSPLLEFS